MALEQPNLNHPQRKHPRLPIEIYKEGHVFFTTICTQDRYRWFELNPELTQQAIITLEEVGKERGASIYAWSFMPDHVHILVQDDDLVQFVRTFKGRLTPLARKFEKNRKLWQTSFYDHVLREEESVFRIAAYIWENSVRAELVQDCVDYPWSGSQVWDDWKYCYKSAQ
jgi:REP element-mobilizing transposase RayT